MAKADGSVIIEIDANPTKAEKQLMQLRQDIEEMETKLHQKTQGKTAIEQSLDNVRNTLAKVEAQYSESLRNGADKAVLKEQETTMAALDRRAEQLEKEFAASGGECDALAKKLDKAKERAGALVTKIVQQREEEERAAAKRLELEEKQRVAEEERAQAEERANSALGKAEQYMDSFVKRVKKLAKNVFVFTLISSALRSLKDGLKSAILSNKEATDSIARLKGALLTLAAPIVDMLIPAVTWLIDALTEIVSEIITIYSILSGKSVDEMKEAAETLYDEANALDKTGSAAKKAAKNLASFDRINKLSSGSSSSSISPKFNFGGKWADAFGGINDVFKTIRAGLDLVIDDFKANYDEGMLPTARETWRTVLIALLGAVLGAKFGGLTGGFIGLTLGALLGLYLAGIDGDESKSVAGLEDELIAVLCGLIGAILGGAFLGRIGAGIGFLLGAIIGLYLKDFTEGEQVESQALLDSLVKVLCSLIGLVIGAKVGGLGGAVVGFAIGTVLGIVIDTFKAGEQGDFARLRNNIIWLLCILIGGIIGTLVTPGIGTAAGVLIGFAVGLLLTTTISKFEEGDEGDESGKREQFRLVLLKLLTTIVGGIVSLVLSATGHPVLSLAVGLAVSFFTESIDDSGLKKATSIRQATSATAVQSAPATYSVPALAQGKVIPPNREFMAILGDQKSGTNIETPLATMVQAFRQALSEGGYNGQSEAYLVLDGEVCGKLVYRLNKAESNRVGVSLVES